jgi:ribonuclease J
MFLIKADNKKILHTGDFREHGLRGLKLIDMLRKYVKQVDVLITEGTMLSRGEVTVKSEFQVMEEAKELIKNSNKKYVFVLCSSTNIDRIACFHEANPQGRYFLCDYYQSDVLDIVTKYGAKYSKLYNFKFKNTYAQNLDERIREKGFCMLVRNSDIFKRIISKFDKDEYLFIYSMWDGYIRREDTKNESLIEFLDGIEVKFLHTSGHATKESIFRVYETVKPKYIIPIHSESPEKLLNLDIDYKVKLLNDGETFEVT